MNDRVPVQPEIPNHKGPFRFLKSDKGINARRTSRSTLSSTNAKFKPDPQNDSRLAEFKSFIEKNPSSVLSVTGYTDLVGTAEFNQELGLKRALTVQKYLGGKGFPAERMKAESGGEDISSDYITEEGRAKVRRAEISVKL